MIYSGVEENWARLTIIHSVAREYYEASRGTAYREAIVSGKGPFPFDCLIHDAMTNESCMVSMVMVWAVVTLEALVNHGLAEMLVHDGASREVVAKTIEMPRQIPEQAKLELKSGLARKVYILASQCNVDTGILVLVDRLSFVRNSIVHDKPFNLIESQDGDVEIEWYNSKDEPKTYRYDDLNWFFEGCDKVVGFISQISFVEHLSGRKMIFSDLL